MNFYTTFYLKKIERNEKFYRINIINWLKEKTNGDILFNLFSGYATDLWEKVNLTTNKFRLIEAE